MAIKSDLRNVNWSSMNHSPETVSNYERFFQIFSELYGKHLSLKVFKSKKNTFRHHG